MKNYNLASTHYATAEGWEKARIDRDNIELNHPELEDKVRIREDKGMLTVWIPKS